MQRFWLLTLLLCSTVARADNVDSFTWSPIFRTFQALTHANGVKQITPAGGAAPTILCSKSANYTVVDADGCEVVLVTTGSSTITVTLPASANNQGRTLTIKKVDSGTGKVTVSRAGSDTINTSLTSFDEADQNDYIKVVAAAANWEIAAKREVTKWKAWAGTMTVPSVTFTADCFQRRVGSSLEVAFRFASNGAAGTGSANVNITFPAAQTMDSAVMTASGGGHVGVGETFGILASGQYDRATPVYAETTTKLRIPKPATGAYYIGTDVPANVTVFAGNFTVPLVEYAQWGS